MRVRSSFYARSESAHLFCPKDVKYLLSAVVVGSVANGPGRGNKHGHIDE
jgi:hypothetical protein